MTLQQLRYILVLKRCKSFAKAAVACHVSQPSLSIAVKNLEQELGVVLFERLAQEVKCTEQGELVIDQAARILDAVDALAETAKQHHSGLEGTVRLGAIFTVGPYILPRMVAHIHQHAPQMRLELEEAMTAQLRNKLRFGELDAALLSSPFAEPGIVTKTLYTEPFLVLMPASHPLSKKQQVTAEDLRGETLLLLGEGHCFRDQVLAMCPDCYEEQPVDGGVKVQTFGNASLETIRNMVATNMGLTILPASAAQLPEYLQSILAVRPFQQKEMVREVVLAWRVSYPKLAVIDLLIQAAKQVAL